jgi:hypothetical protein
MHELNVEFGDINMNCNESFLGNKKPAVTTGPSSSVDVPSDKKSSGVQSKVAHIRKQIVHFPEKVIACFACYCERKIQKS